MAGSGEFPVAVNLLAKVNNSLAQQRFTVLSYHAMEALRQRPKQAFFLLIVMMWIGLLRLFVPGFSKHFP
jgi:hypothetical protein